MAITDPIYHWNINANDYAIKRAAAPSRDPKGYDQANMLIRFRGTIDQLLSAFPIGDENMPDVPSGGRMFCLGPIGQPEYRFDSCEAEIGWVGYFTPPAVTGVGLIPDAGSGTVDGVRGFTTETSAIEANFPQTINDIDVFVDDPFLPSSAGGVTTNPASGTYWSAVLWDDQHIRRYFGTTIGTTSIPPGAPKCVAPDPDASDPINWTNSGSLGARIVRRVKWWPGKTGTNGWRRVSYSCQLDYVFGSVALYSWEAVFEWMQEFGL